MVNLSSAGPGRIEVKDVQGAEMRKESGILPRPCIQSTVVEIHATVMDLEEEDDEEGYGQEESVESMDTYQCSSRTSVETSLKTAELERSGNDQLRDMSQSGWHGSTVSLSISNESRTDQSPNSFESLKSKVFSDSTNQENRIQAQCPKDENTLSSVQDDSYMKNLNLGYTSSGKPNESKECNPVPEVQALYEVEECGSNKASQELQGESKTTDASLDRLCALPNRPTTLPGEGQGQATAAKSVKVPLQELSVASLPQIAETDIPNMAQRFEKQSPDECTVEGPNLAQVDFEQSGKRSSRMSYIAPLAAPSGGVLRSPPGTLTVQPVSSPVSPSTLPALQPAYPESPEIFDVSRRHRAYVCLLRSRSCSDWSSTLSQLDQSELNAPIMSAWDELPVSSTSMDSISAVNESRSPLERKSRRSRTPQNMLDEEKCKKTQPPKTETAENATTKTPSRRRSYPLRNLGWDRARRPSKDDTNVNSGGSRLELDLAQKVILRRKVLESLTPEEKLENPGK